MASYGYTFTSGDSVTPTKLNNARTVSEIVNADIKSDAAIAGTKVAPAFGAQDITVSTANRSITNTGNFALSFGTNNTERVRIANDGNVGIGTSSPAAKLAVFTNSATDTVASIGNTAGNGWLGYLTSGGDMLYGLQSSGVVTFRTNNTDRMRIKSTGQVRFQPLASDPAGGEAGDVYYNSNLNKLFVYNGTAWVAVH